MKEPMSTSTDSSLSPCTIFVFTTDSFRGSDSDRGLAGGSGATLTERSTGFDCLGGVSRVLLLMRRGLDSGSKDL